MALHGCKRGVNGVCERERRVFVENDFRRMEFFVRLDLATLTASRRGPGMA